MNLLDRYIAGAVLKGVAMVILVLVSVGTFIDFMGQVPDVGTAQYDLQAAVTYVSLRVPRMIFQLLPPQP